MSSSIRKRTTFVLKAAAGLCLLAGSNVYGDTLHDLGAATSVTVNGVIFNQFATGPSGSGNIDPFVRITDNEDHVQGVNVNAPTVTGILDEDNGNADFLDSVLLKDIPIETIGVTQYYQLILDNNQIGSANGALISLDELELYTSASGNNNVTDSDADTDDEGTIDRTPLGTLVYDLDAGTDNYVRVNTGIAGSGSGKHDVVVLIPRSIFGQSDPSTTFLYVYSEFGINNVNNDGFEEWSKRTEGFFDPNPPGGPTVPLPGAAVGGAALLGVLAVARSRRSA